MNRSTMLLAVLLASSLMTFAGCGASLEQIPVGEWQGVGTYVDYEATLVKGKPVASDSQARSRTYETTLKITKTEALGRDAWLLAVHSKRGELLNIPGEETKGEITLVELEKLDNGGVLYAVVGDGMPDSPAAGAGAEAASAAGAIASATAVRTSGGLVLEVYYNRPQPDKPVCFTDTFHFRRDGVIKTGAITELRIAGGQDKLMKVCWAEELRRVR